MKQMKEAKVASAFDDMDLKDLVKSLRLNLTKTKGLASSANSRSNEAISDVRHMQDALIRYIDKMNKMERKIEDFYSLPWYKRLFYKGEQNGK